MNLTRKSRKISVTTFFAIIVLASYFLLLNPTSKNHSSGIQLASCYYQKIGSTDSLMQISSQKDAEISGKLVIHNAEKDSSYETFVGKIQNKTLSMNFKFWSEGIESVRPIIYIISGDSLIGEGFTYKPINNCQDITYPQGLSLIPYKVKLPLNLFSNIRISFQDQNDLLQRLGYKDLMPIENVTLIYVPTKGQPVNLAFIYYWEQRVWARIFDPNSPPDFGVVIKSENDRVLSMNTVQDCVYPDKTDCQNVTKLYSALLDKNNWQITNR